MLPTYSIALANLVVVFGVFFWSGGFAEKTIYDKYLVRLEGISFPVRNLEQSVAFYTKVLDIQPLNQVEPSSQQAQLVFPDNRRITLELRLEDTSNQREAEIVRIRVINGLTKLHQALTERSQRPTCPSGAKETISEASPGCVSEIYDSARGREFLVRDLDQNFLFFYQARRFRL